MKRHVFYLVLPALIFLGSCQMDNMDAETPTEPAAGVVPVSVPYVYEPELKTETATVTPVYDETYLIQKFIRDTKIPEIIQVQFSEAIRGAAGSQDCILEYCMSNNDLDLSVYYLVFLTRDGDKPCVENECFYNIGMFYYSGEEYINFDQNKIIAFEWLKLSADMGNSFGAKQAGDMARYGDGVPVDAQAAFDFYSKAASLSLNGELMECLGDCYFEGIGTAACTGKAWDCYLDSALMGNASGLYKLSTIENCSIIDKTLLYKAASSLNYSGGYWSIGYGGLDGYSANDAKTDLISKLSDIWDSGTDSAARKIRDSITENEYFPEDFVEALLKATYSYSYHAFAEKYGIWPNRTHADASNISFVRYYTEGEEYTEDILSQPERYLDYEWCLFYGYDFDGDGEDELGIPLHTGAGGMFMRDGFVIYKKNEDGLYEEFSEGPDCTLRDAMRIIEFDSKIFFIVNPFDDTNNTPHDIIAYTIDENGLGHEMTISCKDYNLRRAISHTDKDFTTGFSDFLACVEEQAIEAVAATKRLEMFITDGEARLSYEVEDNKSISEDWRLLSELHNDSIFTAIDVNNDGIEEMIHRSRSIIQTKYYDDLFWFQIYTNRDDLDSGKASLVMPVFYGEYYGLHSDGNLYDVLPINNNVVQFWTQEYDGAVYCAALQKHTLLYTLQVFLVENDEVTLIRKSLFFDETQGVDIQFS